MHTTTEKLRAFERLLDVMDTLREKCPWDHKQTIQSLRPNTIEETYELSEAILGGNIADIREELGDIIMHIVFYSKIGEESKQFDIADVCNTVCDKLIYRHPHVYPPKDGVLTQVTSSEQVKAQWEQLKTQEKEGNKTVLGGVPESLPALIKAYRIQDKARGVGFDWDEKEQVWTKVKEEIQEFEVEMKAEKLSKEKATAEFGDVMFSLINAARLYHINPDNALEQTNRKFIRRFNYLEQRVKEQGRNLKEMTLQEMDQFWDEAKASEQK